MSRREETRNRTSGNRLLNFLFGANNSTEETTGSTRIIRSITKESVDLSEEKITENINTQIDYLYFLNENKNELLREILRNIQNAEDGINLGIPRLRRLGRHARIRRRIQLRKRLRRIASRASSRIQRMNQRIRAANERIRASSINVRTAINNARLSVSRFIEQRREITRQQLGRINERLSQIQNSIRESTNRLRARLERLSTNITERPPRPTSPNVQAQRVPQIQTSPQPVQPPSTQQINPVRPLPPPQQPLISELPRPLISSPTSPPQPSIPTSPQITQRNSVRETLTNRFLRGMNAIGIALETYRITDEINELNSRENLNEDQYRNELIEIGVNAIIRNVAATGGSIVGAALGSIFGGLGAIPGALIGGSIGYFAGDSIRPLLRPIIISILENDNVNTREIQRRTENEIRNFIRNDTRLSEIPYGLRPVVAYLALVPNLENARLIIERHILRNLNEEQINVVKRIILPEYATLLNEIEEERKRAIINEIRELIERNAIGNAINVLRNNIENFDQQEIRQIMELFSTRNRQRPINRNNIQSLRNIIQRRGMNFDSLFYETRRLSSEGINGNQINLAFSDNIHLASFSIERNENFPINDFEFYNLNFEAEKIIFDGEIEPPSWVLRSFRKGFERNYEESEGPGSVIPDSPETRKNNESGTVPQGRRQNRTQENTPRGTEREGERRDSIEEVPQNQSGDRITEIFETGPGFNVVRFESGRVERRSGTRAWRNNNPGNIEYGDFARRHGAIGSDGRFAIFPTLEHGRRAKEALLFETNRYRNLTIEQAISRYAPPHENNTARYIQEISRALNVDPSTRMSDLTPEQRRIMLSTIERIEGFREGRSRILETRQNNEPETNQTPMVELSQDAEITRRENRQQNNNIIIRNSQQEQQIPRVQQNTQRREIPLHLILERISV